MDAKRVHLQRRLWELAGEFPMRYRKPFTNYTGQLTMLCDVLEETSDVLILKSIDQLTPLLESVRPRLTTVHDDIFARACEDLVKLQSYVQARWVTNYPHTKDLLNRLYEEYWKHKSVGYASLDSGFGVEDLIERAEDLAEEIELKPAAVELFIADFLNFVEFNGVTSMRAVLDKLEATLIQEQAGLL
jgi:hypothetical protein